MKNHFRRAVSLFLLPLMFFSFHEASAENNLSGTITVSPARAEVTLAPGEEREVVLTIKNGTLSLLRVDVAFEDIAAEAQQGPQDSPVRLLGSDSGTSVSVRVAVPSEILPGGRYGSVVFRVSPTDSSLGGEVAVESRIAVPLFVRIEGAVKEEGKLVAFGILNAERFLSSPDEDRPIRFHLSFLNSGDVYLNPHGTISISGFWGEPSHVLVDPYAVLPGSTRLREVFLTDTLPPGPYTATLSLARGYGEDIDTLAVQFFVLPGVITLALILLFVLFLGYLIWRSLRLSRNSISAS
jgi:hypothetical protein